MVRSRWDRAALIALPVYWIALFIATHYPRVTIPDQIPGKDKLVHFTAFGLLAFLRWRFELARRPIGDRFVWITAIVLLAYAAFDEYVQQFVGRFTDLHDFFANATGIAGVLIVLELHRRWRSGRESSRRPLP